jgi:hypothetical protein
VGEELQLGEQEEQPAVGEPTASSAEVETQSLESQDASPEVSPAPLTSFGVPSSGAANETTQLRRGFLKQLLSRLSSGEK